MHRPVRRILRAVRARKKLEFAAARFGDFDAALNDSALVAVQNQRPVHRHVVNYGGTNLFARPFGLCTPQGQINHRGERDRGNPKQAMIANEARRGTQRDLCAIAVYPGRNAGGGNQSHLLERITIPQFAFGQLRLISRRPCGIEDEARFS